MEPIPHSKPRKGDVSVVAMLVDNLQKHSVEELKQILSTVFHETKGRHVPSTSPSKPLDATFTPVHEIFLVLQSLIREGAFRTNIPKLPTFSGEMAEGEVSFEEWCYELLTMKMMYSDSALREGMQRSLRGAAADTVHNLGPDVSLNVIIKKFTIIYYIWEC